jgi:hypothetical protein
MALIAFVALAGLGGIAGCSSAASAPMMPTMPPEPHDPPAVLGPLNGSGNRTFAVTVRPTMWIELGCLGRGMAWVRSPMGGFAVPCGREGSPGNESFGGSHDSVQDLRVDKVRVGQRVSVRVASPAGATWQLWITGGPVSLARRKPRTLSLRGSVLPAFGTAYDLGLWESMRRTRAGTGRGNWPPWQPVPGTRPAGSRRCTPRPMQAEPWCRGRTTTRTRI